MREAEGAVHVEGLRELRGAIRVAKDDLSKGALKGAHLEGATIVSGEAKRIAPRLTGRLASSIRPAGQQAQAVVRAGKKAIPYAGVIHFGWAEHNIAPQPFIYDALDRRADEVIDAYARQVAKIADKLVRDAHA